uniref:Uncharacterized protein n=1 Tax=Rousettus aegyptiacus TaxID=9407 RepID=A0A7J8C2J7_ROUAE|nr:hypothetical protein HJG63_009387 [Rousettus aegyptiacus]
MSTDRRRGWSLTVPWEGAPCAQGDIHAGLPGSSPVQLPPRLLPGRHGLSTVLCSRQGREPENLCPPSQWLGWERRHFTLEATRQPLTGAGTIETERKRWSLPLAGSRPSESCPLMYLQDLVHSINIYQIKERRCCINTSILKVLGCSFQCHC